MVPLLILASGCTSALQGTHLAYRFLLFCAFQVRSVNQQRRSASILSTDCKRLARMIPGSVLRKHAHPDFGLFLTKPSSRPRSRVVHCWMSQCSQASRSAHGCLVLPLLVHFPCASQMGSHGVMEGGETQLSGEDRERSQPQPQLKLRPGPLCTMSPPSWPRAVPSLSPWCSLCRCCGANWRREM